MVVGALIFVLGIDLVKEALWDTRHRVNRYVLLEISGVTTSLILPSSLEYITIASIMVCMTVWDFVIGVIFGIVVSCEYMVVPSQRDMDILTT